MKRIPVAVENLSRLENLSINEFSDWARISRASVYRSIADGSLVATKLRGRTIIRRENALAFTAGAQA